MYGKDRQGIGRPVLVDSSGQLASGLGNAAIEGRLFYCATQAEVACSTDLNVTFTGLALGNPATSGKNYILHEFGYGMSALIVDETLLSLATGVVGGLAAANTVRPALVGGAMNSAAYVDEAATITAPVISKIVCAIDDQVAAVSWNNPPQVLDLRGTIVLSPGYAVFTNSTYAIGAVMMFHFVWEEVDA
jgi:hypothetical protein